MPLALFDTMPRHRKFITIHAAATRPSWDGGTREIRGWHLERGFNDIGYHAVIRRDGTLEAGRPAGRTGAHVGGHNTGNFGICLVGGVKQSDGKTPENNFTLAQWETLTRLMDELTDLWPEATIMGHNGFSGHESRGCPCFDWCKWREEFLRNKRTGLVQFPRSWYDEVQVIPRETI